MLASDQELEEAGNRLGERLLTTGRTVATAESCTGGWVAKVLTDRAGSSAYVLGGLVTYSNEAKQGLLGVTRKSLDEHGAVSEPVVREMVAGALVATDVVKHFEGDRDQVRRQAVLFALQGVNNFVDEV